MLASSLASEGTPFLDALRALREAKSQEQDCDPALQHLQTLLGQMRRTVRAMAKGQLAEEDGIMNQALSSLYSGAASFRGDTEAAARAFCSRTIKRKFLDHRRHQHGVLLYVGGSKVNTGGFDEENRQPQGSAG